MYAELHCKTNFSFLEGASHPSELVERAAELGCAALAVTDRDSLAGIVRAHAAAKDVGLKLLVGAQVAPQDAPPLVLWATNRAAYGRLARLLTVGRRRASKGACQLTLADVAAHADGLLAGILPAPASRAEHLDRSPYLLRDLFGDRLYLLAHLHQGSDDQGRLAQRTELARATGIPLVAAGDVHYHVPERMPLHHVLTAIRRRTTVREAEGHLQPNAVRHLRSPAEIAAAFAAAPAALAHSLEIVQRCRFSLDELRYEYPLELAPPGKTPLQYLTDLTWEGACRRYPDGVPQSVRRLLEHELSLIEELRYEPYFLTVWDLVRFAGERGILCQGRGSAANSAVCYCLGITAVDPKFLDVLFERFVSRERNEAPDIDVDFEHERREEVLQYLYEKYGRERAGLTAEVITYRMRSAVRDVGKALGLSLDRVDLLAKSLDGRAVDADLPRRCRQSGIDPDARQGRQLTALVRQLVGFPRHLSQHVGGMVITRGPLCELVPIENAAMADRTVIQWDKDDLDALGILKVDCLALGMLTAIRKCFALVRQRSGRRLSLASVPPEDPQVYAMISRADTMGVFQIESRAQMSMLPRLQPRCFYDLVIEVAIVRPGPIQGNMVHPYLRRRNGEEPVVYPNAAIRDVLKKTLGVPLFQEQAMRLAVVAAGFTPGEADQLRRAMGAWRRPGVIDQFRRKLMQGMLANGLTDAFAEHVFSQIRGFGEYGFPESHAASFAQLVYVSAWLKCHEPAAFAAALLNSQPMGFYAPAQLVRDVQQHGVSVLGIDVNFSRWDCTLGLMPPSASGPSNEASHVATHALRLGLRMIVGLSAAQGRAIEAARADGPFESLDALARRARLSPTVLKRLAAADALRSLQVDRRQSLWQVLGQRADDELPLFAGLPPAEDLVPALPAMTEQQQVDADYQTAGLTLRSHPLSFFREQLHRRGVSSAAELLQRPNNRSVQVAGLVLLRQRPSTAKGITFVTLEDETGTANLVIHQRTWERFYRVARTASGLIAHGRLERQGQVVHVIVRHLEDLSERLHDLHAHSRDFR